MSAEKAPGASRVRPGKIGPEIIEHWFTLVPAQHFSSNEFYDEVADEIAVQKVPSLDISRIELPEGGLLSDNREYLRMRRERLTFDVCAATVGVNFFFSYRFYVQPAEVKPWQVAIILVFLWILFVGSIRFFGIILGPMVLFSSIIVAGWTMRNAIGLGLRDLDASLLKMPVIGAIYERFFRQDTYYRQDLRIAYCSIVSAIVKGKVERITSAKGVKLLREFAYNPVFEDLYKVRNISPSVPASNE